MADETPAEPRRGSPVVLGFAVLVLTVLAGVVMVVLPAVAGDLSDATVVADDARNYPAYEGGVSTPASRNYEEAEPWVPPAETEELIAEGHDIYVAENCASCHTQQVRQIGTDVGLGPASRAGDYAHEDIAAVGSERVGPDLAFAGSREPTNDPAWVAAFLADPRAVREWSNQPPYDYLSERDRWALAYYVATLDDPVGEALGFEAAAEEPAQGEDTQGGGAGGEGTDTSAPGDGEPTETTEG